MDKYELEKLLYRWILRRVSYTEQVRRTDDPERIKTIMSMDFQLEKCIEELENVLKGEDENLTRRLLAGIQNAQEENNEPNTN